MDSLKKTFEELKWEAVLNHTDTNMAFSSFSDIIQSNFDRICPITEVKFKSKELKNPWITNGLKKSSKRKQKLYNNFLKTRSNADELIYKNYKSMFQKLLKKAKSNYYTNQLNKYKSDPKKSWNIINEVTGRKKVFSDPFPKTVIHGGVTLNDKHKICSAFNNLLC